MPITPPVDIHCLVSFSCSDQGNFDHYLVRKHMRDVLDGAAADGTLLALGDDTTHLGPMSVQIATSPEDMILAMMSDTIKVSPGARQVVEECLKLLRRDYSRDARQLLTAADREHLVKGISQTRQSYERQEGTWIDDAIRRGYSGWSDTPDEVLLVDAFLDHSCLQHLDTDADRIAVLSILARFDVLATLFPLGASAEAHEELEQDIDSLVAAIVPSCQAAEDAAAQAVDLRNRIVYAVQALIPEPEWADAPGA